MPQIPTQKVFWQTLRDLIIWGIRPKLFGNFLLHNRKICSTYVKKIHRSIKIKMKVKKIDALTYFDHRHSSVNSIWYPCCLSLERQYLRTICGLLSCLKTLNIHRKVNFRINDNLDLVIIVCQKHLS